VQLSVMVSVWKEKVESPWKKGGGQILGVTVRDIADVWETNGNVKAEEAAGTYRIHPP